MATKVFRNLGLAGAAAMVAAGGSLLASASGDPSPAYDREATTLEAREIAQSASKTFDRADLNNDGYVSQDEYQILAIVTAELSRLNGFVAIDGASGVQKVGFGAPSNVDMPAMTKRAIISAAQRQYALLSGEDQKLTRNEFIDGDLETFIASDRDRDGVLTGDELLSFAAARARVGVRSS